MKIKVTAKSTLEEIEILKSASKMINAIADDIDDEDVRTFADFEGDDLRSIRDNIDDIIKELEKLKREEEE